MMPVKRMGVFPEQVTANFDLHTAFPFRFKAGVIEKLFPNSFGAASVHYRQVHDFSNLRRMVKLTLHPQVQSTGNDSLFFPNPAGITGGFKLVVKKSLKLL